ncbi:MAG: hypothetical protein RLP10_23980, partial [Roseibium album]
AGVSHVANLVHRTDEEPPVCEGPSDANGQCVVTPTGLPIPASNITVVKRAGFVLVHRGDQVPYTILVTNNSSNNPITVTVTDRIPSGFRYVPGSASVDGVPSEPYAAGRTLSFSDVTISGGKTLEVHLKLLVLSTAQAGDHKNFANALDPQGKPAGPDAEAVVRVVVDPVFECAEIIGKVFTDTNGNGVQDKGEVGLPGVRLATSAGVLITTDAYGRYHVPCGDLPDSRIGSNYILKVDTRTLPTGYRLTTENPRVVRLTAGKMTKLNFGAAISRVVRLALKDEAFDGPSIELKPQWKAGLLRLIKLLEEEQSTLRLSYVDADVEHTLAVRRLEKVRHDLKQMWTEKRGRYRLEIETRVETNYE